jgi:hypothetical protein
MFISRMSRGRRFSGQAQTTRRRMAIERRCCEIAARTLYPSPKPITKMAKYTARSILLLHDYAAR